MKKNILTVAITAVFFPLLGLVNNLQFVDVKARLSAVLLNMNLLKKAHGDA